MIPETGMAMAEARTVSVREGVIDVMFAVAALAGTIGYADQGALSDETQKMLSDVDCSRQVGMTEGLAVALARCHEWVVSMTRYTQEVNNLLGVIRPEAVELPQVARPSRY